MSIKTMNKVASHVSVQRLREAVDYNEETGAFVWKTRPEHHFQGKAHPARWNGKYAGKTAFTSACPRGYFRGCLDGAFLYAHRAAIALRDGKWPDGEVDHVNRDKSDNRLENLRVVSHRENRLNTADCENDLAGIRRGKSGQYVVQCKVKGRSRYVGSFGSLVAAISARNAARAAL